MTDNTYEIVPEYRFLNSLRNVLAAIALIICVFSIFLIDPLNIIFSVACLVVATVLPKRFLKINEEGITIESKYMIKALNQIDTIQFNKIKKVVFVKKHIRFLNITIAGHAAEYEHRKILLPDKMIIYYEKRGSRVVFRIGRPEEFFKAYEIIRNRVGNRDVTDPNRNSKQQTTIES